MRSRTALLAAAAVLLAVSLTAQAGLIQAPLGDSGWTVVGATGGDVSIVVDSQGVDQDGKSFIAVEIVKVFRDGLDPQTNTVPSIALNFIQTGSDDNTAERIYITDESITNLTGVTWVDFHWVIAGTNTAMFNEDLTNVTTDPQETGFLISPFTEHAWSANQGLGTQTLSVWGGQVPNGGALFPGIGEGNLVIDVVGLDRPGPAVFVLKELPTIPEPASLLLVTGGLAVVVLKRRTARA